MPYHRDINPWVGRTVSRILKEMDRPSDELLYVIADEHMLQMLKNCPQPADVLRKELTRLYDASLNMPTKQGEHSLDVIKKYPTSHDFVKKWFESAENRGYIVLVGENYQLTERGRKVSLRREQRSKQFTIKGVGTVSYDPNLL